MQRSPMEVIYGIEGIQSVYEKCLSAKRVDFMCTSSGYGELLGDWYEQEFAPRLFKSAITTREILVDTQENRAYAKSKPTKNEVRFVSSQYASETDIVLWDDTVALVAFEPSQPLVMLIMDGEAAKAVKNMFAALWEKLA